MTARSIAENERLRRPGGSGPSWGRRTSTTWAGRPTRSSQRAREEAGADRGDARARRRRHATRSRRGGGRPGGAVDAFLVQEREFLQRLAALVQGHAESVKGMARASRDAARRADEGSDEGLDPDEPTVVEAAGDDGPESAAADRRVDGSGGRGRCARDRRTTLPRRAPRRRTQRRPRTPRTPLRPPRGDHPHRRSSAGEGRRRRRRGRLAPRAVLGRGGLTPVRPGERHHGRCPGRPPWPPRWAAPASVPETADVASVSAAIVAACVSNAARDVAARVDGRARSGRSRRDPRPCARPGSTRTSSRARPSRRSSSV